MGLVVHMLEHRVSREMFYTSNCIDQISIGNTRLYMFSLVFVRYGAHLILRGERATLLHHMKETLHGLKMVILVTNF